MVKKKASRKRKVVMSMKCSRCGYRTSGGIKAMGAHYRKKHPKVMKRK